MIKKGLVLIFSFTLSGCGPFLVRAEPERAAGGNVSTVPAPTLNQSVAPVDTPTDRYLAYSDDVDTSIANLDQDAGGLSGISPGQCWVYAQVKHKAVKENIDVLIQDSTTKITVTPAELKRGLTTVVTREGAVTYKIIPAKYKQVIEQVVVRPEVVRYKVEPAVYAQKEVEVVVEQARSVMEPCETSGTQFSKGTGVQAFCSSLVPQKTRKIIRKELIKPEMTRMIVEPAETREVTRWVVVAPAQAVSVDVQPETERLDVENLVSAESVTLNDVPPVTKSMVVTRYEGEAKVVSRRAVCDADMTKDLIKIVQRKLLDRGYYPGRLDGIVGTRTIDALKEYQVANALAVGALTYESLQQLGVETH